jgi:hypothetical protein
MGEQMDWRIEDKGGLNQEADTMDEALGVARSRLQEEENPGPQMVVSNRGSVIIQLDPDEPCFIL